MASLVELRTIEMKVESALTSVRGLNLDHLEFLLSMALREAKSQTPKAPRLRLVSDAGPRSA